MDYSQSGVNSMGQDFIQKLDETEKECKWTADIHAMSRASGQERYTGTHLFGLSTLSIQVRSRKRSTVTALVQ